MTSYKVEILEQLVKAAVAVDGVPPKIYWHLLDKPRVRPWDFWLCDEEKLIAFFGAYEFETNCAEITGVIHPEYRRQGIFKNFLMNFKKRHPELKKITLVGSSAIVTEVAMEKVKARFIESEFELSVIPARSHVIPASPHVIPAEAGIHPQGSRFRGNDDLSLASLSDLDQLLKIDLACFNSQEKEVKRDLEMIFQDPTRKIYLFSSENKVLGKIHLRFEDKKIMLSDIAILPEFQKQGFGSQMLQSVFALYPEAEFNLDVHAANRDALAFYEKQGFVVKNEYLFFLSRVGSSEA